MLLKISFIVIYLSALFRFLVKWKNCGFIVQGNEMLLLQAIMPVAFLIPARVEGLMLRLPVFLSIFGICSFWIRLFPKIAGTVLKSAVIYILLLFSLEVLAFLFHHVGICVYLVSIVVVLIFFYAICFLKCEDEKMLKSILNMGKLRNAVAVSSFPSVISVILLAIYHLCGRNNYIGLSFSVIGAMLPLVYIYRHKPACWNYDEMVELKKRAYLLGKAINKEEQCLEDDGGIINGNVVEDVRILYNIMKLFEEEKVYRNYEIKIGDVARRIGTNKTYLSRALNTRVSKNFCQFVNHYRIREICSLYLKDPKKEIRNLSEQCGFSSQSNFSIVFKYNTGYTPGDWCKMVKVKLERNEEVDIEDYLL